MKTYLFLMMILLSAASISADNYNEYLEASRKHLANGNKENAESCYRIYTKMTGKKDAELEKAFSGSAQSGNIEYRVVLIMTEKYENGDVYEGEEKDGIRHGIGIYYHADGAIYEGEWKDDLIHGIGRYYYPDGAAENVLCENGKIVGSTKETLPQSEIRIHSIGYDNDDLYHGNMKDGKRNGRGTMHYADRRKYVGEWKDDKYHGKGTYYFVSGDRYVGEFKDEKKMVEALFIGLMVLAMRANSRMINAMVNARCISLMVLAMRANSRITGLMVKEHIISLMASAMRANSKTENAMVKAHII